jgi:hypothetical protein
MVVSIEIARAPRRISISRRHGGIAPGAPARVRRSNVSPHVPAALVVKPPRAIAPCCTVIASSLIRGPAALQLVFFAGFSISADDGPHAADAGSNTRKRHDLVVPKVIRFATSPDRTAPAPPVTLDLDLVALTASASVIQTVNFASARQSDPSHQLSSIRDVRRTGALAAG